MVASTATGAHSTTHEKLQLSNHFLIAMPQTPEHIDDYFHQSVVYLCDHSDRGSSGIVINKPAEHLTFSQLFDKIQLPLRRADLARRAIIDGGPVDVNKGFILHEAVECITDAGIGDGYESSLSVAGSGLQLTSSKDIIEAISEGAGPKKLLMTLGYAAWHGGQLEEELSANMWLTVAADTSIIFDTPIEQRYKKALALLGLNEMWAIAPEAGHA